MLSLNPGSVCDVCAEEYGPHRLPHSIPCGHVLCASCCSTIVEKTAARLQPVCPFCRESFTNDSIRLIRLDFPTSGWSTPRRKGGTIEANVLGFVEPDITGELLARHSERFKIPADGSKARSEARRLEDKVAKVAAKKCSVEEVTTLHKELQEWLSSDTKPDDQTSSLFLSAALLRAILMNHVAHSEANRISKHMEADLKGKLDGLVNHNRQLDAELRKERQQLAQKTQECNNLRTELSRLKALASTIGVASNSSSPEPTSHPSSPSPTPPATPSNASTPTMSYNTHAPTPLSRFNSIHARSASLSSRPSTPAGTTSSTSPSSSSSNTPAPPTSVVSPYRSHTPGPSPSRAHTQTPAILRSQTPSVRSYTPSVRASTPGIVSPTHSSHPHQYRSQTPAPPLPSSSLANNGILPSRPRRLSVNMATTMSSPSKIARSVSEEKQEMHARWLPLVEPDSPVPTSKTPGPYATGQVGSRSRTVSTAAAQAVRYKSSSPNDN